MHEGFLVLGTDVVAVAVVLPVALDQLGEFLLQHRHELGHDGRAQAERLAYCVSGTGVFGGMIAATFIATVFIPLFFVVLSRAKIRAPDDAPVIVGESTA